MREPTPPGSRGDGTSLDSSYWDEVSDRIRGDYYHDAVIGHVKRDAHLRLIARWCGDLRGKTVLKTDLFEEAHGPDRFLFELDVGEGLRLGLDISPSIARRARRVGLMRGGLTCPVVAGDVLALPLRAACLDVVVSNSTLDHFADRRAIATALREVYRVLRPGGILVVTLDNPRSLSYAMGRIKRLLRPDPFYMGYTLSIQELRMALIGLGYRVTDTTAILHGLENHSSAAMRWLGWLCGPRLPRAIGTLLTLAERLEAAPTRYLTGAFIAARALKPRPPAELPGRE
jgi:SAM-dependent methyltransferase